MTGRLVLVSTPIGNLGDISPRAVSALSEAHLLVAEDTRRLRALLSHLGIGAKPLRAINAHAGERQVAAVVEQLLGGASVAYATDAGSPAVSDPGRALVSAAAQAGIKTLVVPGPSAVTAAVALSGLVDGAFCFLGFLPRRGSGRSQRLRQIERSPDPCVLFESPQRAAATLQELADRIPERQAYIGRELTKLHEESLRGSLAELAEPRQWRGELVFVIAAGLAAVDLERQALLEAALRAGLDSGAAPSRLARRLSELLSVPRAPLYQRALALAAESRADAGPGEVSNTDDPIAGKR